MERVTFPETQVVKTLAELAIARIDIDTEANRDVCRRLQGNEGVPTFVLLDAAGTELHRWVGGGDAERFLAELRRGGDEVARATQSALEHHGALAEHYLRGNDAEHAAEQMRAIERLDPERKSATLANALWVACTMARQRCDWPALRAAALRYVELPQPPNAEEARLLLSIAEFEISGTMSPELQQYTDARLAVLGTSPPGYTIGERLQRWLGSAETAQGAVSDWVDSQNKAMEELGAVGGAAAASLRAALLAKPTAALHAAVVLGRLRLPESTPWLIERLKDPSTPAWAHRYLVYCIGMHKEKRCLSVLLDFAGERHPAAVRSEAVQGIRDLLVLTGGTTRQDVADVIANALESRDLRLLSKVLQALFYVHAPMPLDRLLELLGDERSLDWDDYRICDNTLWILANQLGT